MLTPHPGEWQRISGESAGDRDAQCRAAVEISAASGAVVLLKGARTFVTDGGGQYVNPTGNPGMASGGSGDVLTGLSFPITGGYVTVSQLVIEGVAIGNILVGGAVFHVVVVEGSWKVPGPQ